MRDNTARVLGIYLVPEEGKRIRIGNLTRFADDSVRFDVDEAYIDLGPSRPILSLAWVAPGDEGKTVARLRDPSDKRAFNGMLPPWFWNLLPEGALRALVESQMPTGRTADFDVLEWLGADLPGAVVAVHEAGPSLAIREAKRSAPPPPEGNVKVRFSLAGVQLKFSALKREESLTLPAQGTTGDIIAKLPSAKIPHLPEVEFSSMKLAEAAGISVAPCELVPVSNVAGLPGALLSPGPYVLAVERFDRNGKRRIHIEDFAQILGAVDNQKYGRANDETVIKMVGFFSANPAAAFLEAAARVAVNILLGNTDAHLKNWSLIYSDGLHAQLSPAYDILAIYVYDRSNDMALKFQGTRSAATMGMSKFERTARRIGMPPKAMLKHVRTTVERAADIWPALLPGLPMPNDYKNVLRQRWGTLALTDGVTDAFKSALESSTARS